MSALGAGVCSRGTSSASDSGFASRERLCCTRLCDSVEQHWAPVINFQSVALLTAQRYLRVVINTLRPVPTLPFQ
ncbi:hypothetical protein BDW72DRAFT_174959 [Aspergillus terricola var. indicus]